LGEEVSGYSYSYSQQGGIGKGAGLGYLGGGTETGGEVITRTKRKLEEPK